MPGSAWRHCGGPPRSRAGVSAGRAERGRQARTATAGARGRRGVVLPPRAALACATAQTPRRHRTAGGADRGRCRARRLRPQPPSPDVCGGASGVCGGTSGTGARWNWAQAGHRATEGGDPRGDQVTPPRPGRRPAAWRPGNSRVRAGQAHATAAWCGGSAEGAHRGPRAPEKNFLAAGFALAADRERLSPARSFSSATRPCDWVVPGQVIRGPLRFDGGPAGCLMFRPAPKRTERRPGGPDGGASRSLSQLNPATGYAAER